MKPHTYRVHFIDASDAAGHVDKTTRAAANGLRIVLIAQGCTGVYVQPIGY